MARHRVMLIPTLLLVALVVISAGCLVERIQPPVAKVDPKIDTLFGRTMVDNYHWLRERGNPEVIKYLEAENDYADKLMEHTEAFQEKLYGEMLGRIKETDLSVPVRRDEYYYYSRTEEGKQYSIYCRKKESLDAPEEILLDVNQLAEGLGFTSLGIYEVSPDHRLLAFGVDTSGSERYTLRVKDLKTGELFGDVIDSVATSLEWANDSRTFFYTVVDDAWRPFELYRHELGRPVSDDVLVLREDDEAFWLDIAKSKDTRYVFIKLGSQTTSEVRFLDADRPTDSFRMIQARKQGMEYKVSHHGDHFYIVTNDEARNFKLVRTPVARTSMENWQEVIPHREDVKLDRVEAFRDYMVLYEREDGFRQIRIRNVASGQTHRIEFPEPVYVCWGAYNPEFNGSTLRFTYTSLITPESVYDYDMDTRERELKKQKEILGGYDPEQYQSERAYALAPDSTLVPVSIVYRKDMVKDGSNPLYLYGYGAYGMSSEPYFSSNRLSLLDRGFIYAKAHVRGGGEMGRYWYDEGKLLNKKNTFTDFIAVAEYMVAQKYTSPDRLVCSGGSAGGLLIGAVINMRPDLFHAAVTGVPFVDVINTMLDESIPLTVIEFDEWGNPKEREYFDYMLSYSPYDNVVARDYPNMLIRAGLNDTRVQYWEPAKWTAKLRAMKTDRNRLLLKTSMGAGHGGVSGRYSYLRELAFDYAFVLDVMGIEE